MARAALAAVSGDGLSKGTLAIQEGLSALQAEGANTTSLKLDNVCKFTEVMARLRLGHGRTQARL